jgi:hypothetical protein
VFRRGHPEWLNELIADRRGRQLIYELSAAHRNSLLLNYAIQRILKQVCMLVEGISAWCIDYGMQRSCSLRLPTQHSAS